MKSIIQADKEHCFMCGKNAHADYFGIEEHHVFSGTGIRPLSEKYGLKVYLCHHCHNEPPNGVHHNRERRLLLQKVVQKRAMKYYGWTTEQFIEIFRKNYI